MIEAVVFDVGETLLDDTAEWAAWADWLKVPRHTLSALIGALTAAGRDNAEAFEYLRPGVDIGVERQRREDAGKGEHITESTLYPDVQPALTQLRSAGLWIGVAGNQTARAAELLRALDLPVDAIATSGEWGTAKPSHEFFDRVVAMTGKPADRVLYVGDHRDNDIVAGSAAGLATVLIRRGPWGHLWADDPLVKQHALTVVNSLHDLAQIVINAPPAG
jgi:FMN phosphatase YigB (HAD superfamily)